MSRVFFAAIVIFWLTMTTLLVRMQVRPEASALREVPPSRVLALLFEHQQTSSLNFRHADLRYGGISLNPVTEENGTQVLKYGGNVLLRASYLPHDRLSIGGQLRFGDDLHLSGAQGSLGLRDAKTRVVYQFDQSARTLDYTLERGGEAYRRGSIALDKPGLERLATELGLDPGMLDTAFASGSAIELTAHYSTFGYREEKVDAYSLVLKRGNTTLAEAFISQLGQVLLVKTPFGLELAPDDFLP